jgi:hypothetical protein
MPALPWTQRQAVDPGRTYLAMAPRPRPVCDG